MSEKEPSRRRAERQDAAPSRARPLRSPRSELVAEGELPHLRAGVWDLLGALVERLGAADPERLAHAGLDTLGALAGAGRASIYRLEPDGGLRLGASDGGGAFAERMAPCAAAWSLMGRALERRAPLFIVDVDRYRARESLPPSPLVAAPGGGCIVLPIATGKRAWGALNLRDLRAPFPGRSSARGQALLHGARLLALAFAQADVRRDLEERAARDGLTRLYNQSTFQGLLAREAARARRYRTPLSLILIDVDFFKEVNDRFGHLAGDAVLVELAARIDAAKRAPDIAARNGGDEFGVILPQTPIEGALRVARRFLVSIGDTPFRVEGASVDASISLGVAELVEGMSAVDLARKADANLYRAKGAGRRCIAAGEDTPIHVARE